MCPVSYTHLDVYKRQGYDNVDLAAATAHNVCVMNTPGQNSNAVAELAFGMMVMAVRNFYNGPSGCLLYTSMVVGLIPGSIGETSVIAIALCAIILLWTGVASWKTMFSVFAGGIVMGDV